MVRCTIVSHCIITLSFSIPSLNVDLFRFACAASLTLWNEHTKAAIAQIVQTAAGGLGWAVAICFPWLVNTASLVVMAQRFFMNWTDKLATVVHGRHWLGRNATVFVIVTVYALFSLSGSVTDRAHWWVNRALLLSVW